MRKVTKKVCGAFMRRESAKCGNTRTDGNRLILHGNVIAEHLEGSVWISASGWMTSTTKDRLNAIPGVRIHQQSFRWFLNGQSWDGGWTKISGSASVSPVVHAATEHAKAKADLFV